MKQKQLIIGGLVGLAVVSGYFYADHAKHEFVKERIDTELTMMDGTSPVKYGALQTSLFSNAVTLKNVTIDMSGLQNLAGNNAANVVSIESVTVDSEVGLSSLESSKLPSQLEVTLNGIATEVDFKLLAENSVKPAEKVVYQTINTLTDGKPTTDFYLEYDYSPAKGNSLPFVDIKLKSELNKVAGIEVKAEIENMPLDPVVLMFGGMQRALIHHFELVVKDKGKTTDLLIENMAKQMNMSEKQFEEQLTDELKKDIEYSQQAIEKMFYSAVEDFVDDRHEFKIALTPKTPMTIDDIQKVALFAADEDEIERELNLKIKGK
jgi:type 1 fimbria pilin